jgi:hypothetical protein
LYFDVSYLMVNLVKWQIGELAKYVTRLKIVICGNSAFQGFRVSEFQSFRVSGF